MRQRRRASSCGREDPGTLSSPSDRTCHQDNYHLQLNMSQVAYVLGQIGQMEMWKINLRITIIIIAWSDDGNRLKIGTYLWITGKQSAKSTSNLNIYSLFKVINNRIGGHTHTHRLLYSVHELMELSDLARVCRSILYVLMKPMSSNMLRMHCRHTQQDWLHQMILCFFFLSRSVLLSLLRLIFLTPALFLTMGVVSSGRERGVYVNSAKQG